jgi:hypothetical protein
MDIFFLIAVIVVPFALIWVVLLEVIARSGGWKRVAERYRATVVPEGRMFRMQHCAFGWVDYNGCVTIIVTAEGIYLALMALFRLSHPPLLIPWSALHVLKLKTSGWSKEAKLSIDEPPIATLKLPYKVIEAAEGLLPVKQTAEVEEPASEREE